MTLDIRLFRSDRAGLRVDVRRKYRQEDENGKGKYIYRQIGSFPLIQSYDATLANKLDIAELSQLQNWMADIYFGEQFDTPADELTRYNLYMPQKFYYTMSLLAHEAKRVDIDFIPHRVMLESLLTTAKQIERRLDKINGFPSKILEKIGVDSSEAVATQTSLEAIDNESKTLFQALLKLPQDIKQTCVELENAARQYGKSKRIPPTELQSWARVVKGQPDKRVKKWAYAIAIDVLQQHGINVLEIAPPNKVAAYWAIQRQEQMTLHEAIDTFEKNFSILPYTTTAAAVVEAIIAVYKDSRGK